MSVSVLCFFLVVPSVGLQSLTVVFLGHTHLLFNFIKLIRLLNLSHAYSPQELEVRPLYHFMASNPKLTMSLRDIVSFLRLLYKGDIRTEVQA